MVWNEHRRDYKPNTIGGDFGNVQIVVTPLPNGLYAIDIFRDQRVSLLFLMAVSSGDWILILDATLVGLARSAGGWYDGAVGDSWSLGAGDGHSRVPSLCEPATSTKPETVSGHLPWKMLY